MSRGPGKVQRELVAALQHHARNAASAHEAACGISTAELAAIAYFGDPRCRSLVNEAQLVSVRRALAGLARHDLVVRIGTLGFLDKRACRWHIGAWAFGQSGPADKSRATAGVAS